MLYPVPASKERKVLEMIMNSKAKAIFGRGISILASAALLVGMLQNGIVVADPSAGLSKSGKAEVGKTISINVSVSGDGPYGGYDGSISYDSSYLELQDISAGNYGAANFGKSGSHFLDYNCNIASGSTIVVAEFVCLQEGSTTVSVSLNVSSLDGLADYGTGTSANIDIAAPVVLSGNNYLSSLSVAPGSLSPSFNKDTQTYYVKVGENQSSIAVSATAEHSEASISLNGVQNNLSNGDNTVKVTVTAENGDTRTYKIIVTRGTPTPTPEPYPIIESGGNSYTILEPGSLENIPSGFSWSETTYNSKKVPCLVGPDGTLLMWLLSDSGNGLYRYDLETQTVSPCYSYSSEAVSMMFLPFPKDFAAPAGYELTTLTIDEHEIEAYKNPASEDQPVLVYLLDAEGHEGVYYYDEKTGMILPFRGELTVATPTPLPTDTPTPSPTPTPIITMSPSPTVAEVKTGSDGNGYKIATIALAVACAGLLAALCVLLVLRQKDKNENTDEYAEETQNPDADDDSDSVDADNEGDHYYQFGDEPEMRRPGAKQAGVKEEPEKKEEMPEFPEFPDKKPEAFEQTVVPTPKIKVVGTKIKDTPSIEGEEKDTPAIEGNETDTPAIEGEDLPKIEGTDAPDLDTKDFASEDMDEENRPDLSDVSSKDAEPDEASSEEQGNDDKEESGKDDTDVPEDGDKDEGEVSDVVFRELAFSGDLFGGFAHGFATDDVIVKFFSKLVLFDGEEEDDDGSDEND